MATKNLALTGEIKNTADMNRLLINQIDAVVRGETEPKKARAICSLAQQVYNMANLEIKSAQVARKLEGREVEPVQLF